MKKRRVLVLFDTDYPPPADQDYSRRIATGLDEVEFEVAAALAARGHAVRCLGFRADVRALIDGLTAEPFDVAFNLTEGFRGVPALDHTVTGVLDMLNVPYTGAGPTGLILARHKALTKIVLRHYGVPTPRFVEVPIGDKARKPEGLDYPLMVKPVDEDASVGIAHASVVQNDEALAERVAFVHEKVGSAALVEEFIAGRELYVGVVGNDPPQVLPPIEMRFPKGVPEEQRIATFKVKWSSRHREAVGIKNRVATDLPADVLARIAQAALTSYRAAGLRDYGRIDIRLGHDSEPYVVEANPNPYLSDGEDMAWAAEEGGHPYPDLLEAICEWALVCHGRA